MKSIPQRDYNKSITFKEYVISLSILGKENREEAFRELAKFFCIKAKRLSNLLIEVIPIIEAITFWQEKDKLLVVEHTTEEITAGIKEVCKIGGHMATAIHLAKQFGQDPDTIYSWTYEKVYSILKIEYINHLYQKRLGDLLTKKNTISYKDDKFKDKQFGAIPMRDKF